MTNIFEIKDCTDRMIRLTAERWLHINQEHPEISSLLDFFEGALKTPTKKTTSSDVIHYYFFVKGKKAYLLLIVKYLNGEGFIITAYLTKSIK